MESSLQVQEEAIDWNNYPHNFYLDNKTFQSMITWNFIARALAHIKYYMKYINFSYKLVKNGTIVTQLDNVCWVSEPYKICGYWVVSAKDRWPNMEHNSNEWIPAQKYSYSYICISFIYNLILFAFPSPMICIHGCKVILISSPLGLIGFVFLCTLHNARAFIKLLQLTPLNILLLDSLLHKIQFSWCFLHHVPSTRLTCSSSITPEGDNNISGKMPNVARESISNFCISQYFRYIRSPCRAPHYASNSHTNICT